MNNFGKKLIQSYPLKEIYVYAKFNIIPKEILQMEVERTKLVKEFESRILLRIQVKTELLTKSIGSSGNTPKK